MMSKKRMIPIALACFFICLACAGSAAAYLTDTETVCNTFTIGEVTIDLLEPDYPGNGSDETTDLAPLEEVHKNPQIYNSGKNRSIVYMRVDIPMAPVIVTDDAGTRQPEENLELFEFRTSSGAYSSVNETWHLLSTVYLDDEEKETDKEKAVICRRLYGYEDVTETDQSTDSLFDVVRLINLVENQLDNTTQEIVLFSYAIQAENIAELTEADMERKVLSAKELADIWDVYFAQSAAVVSDDADSSNNQTLQRSTLNITMAVENTQLKLNTGDSADAKTSTSVKLSYTGSGTAPFCMFSSSDQDVATVDANGNITAVSVGQTVITASALNPDDGKLHSASVTVTVRDVNSGN